MLLKLSKVKCGFGDRKEKKKTHPDRRFWQNQNQTESFPSLKKMLLVTYRNVPAFAHKV